MTTFKLEIVTAERLCYSDEINILVAPGVEGQISILPYHASLITMLQPGELLIKKDTEEISWAISGGFLEVYKNKIIILADTCEQAEEINVARAEEAKRRAEENLKARIDIEAAEASLKRALIRLKVVQCRKYKSV